MDPGWEEVYSGYYRRLVALITALAGSRAEAEEAVQEAFARAIGLTGRRPLPDDPEAWLCRVAVNIVRSRWRRIVNGRRAMARLSVTEGDDTSTRHADARMALLAALRRLPFEQREAIALHYLADLPLEAIAARVDKPVGTVKSRLFRGREALARLLADESVQGGVRHE